MTLTLVTIPCLADNYAFLLHDSDTGETAVADVPESWPIQAELEERGWRLSHILITHHHDDHIDGVEELRKETGAKVIGAAADAHRLPPLDLELGDGDSFDFAGHQVDVLDVSGHTVGHIAFHIPDARAVFTGDSLMALGCGRLFEGTPTQMRHSLSALASLPDDTQVCSGHEYTAANARFALSVDPDNPALIQRARDIEVARAASKATVPSLLSLEKATNPFLRAHLPKMKASLGMSDATDTAVFAEIRARKDRF
ncbi:hydroxyacylglutathione hydrolase [Aliiroseovarius subalbicans]|uniref:hydroxyacylglutathione hydrolase n=1 Tax=Aliiroseovarius subalbicans TaxID=2925840 RepID=UPI001F5A860B|nr:hydroxyacylglutathione hydrolase [Aliiroseovarius subalbicans]MCI2400610.1 hydroxyacylglutathione hydrolase [Aliiroseovarius subalbicans]